MKKINFKEIEKINKKVDWTNNIGKRIFYEWDSKAGHFLILNYFKSNRKLLIQDSNGYGCFLISAGHLKELKLSYIFCDLKKDYKYKKYDTIDMDYGTILIKGRYVKNSQKFYMCEIGNVCKIMKESEIYRSRKKLSTVEYHKKFGKKIYQTHPESKIYFLNTQDIYDFSYGSNRKTYLICPNCNCIKYQKISDLYCKGFSCPCCSDGISYPNKFFANFLKQQSIEFKAEVGFEWSNLKRYDYYIPKLNTIVEIHGLQHYEDVGGYMEDYAKQEKNDKYKREIALSNGIQHYYEINCSISNPDYIYNNIKKSGILEIIKFNESKFNIELLEIESQKSLLIKVCEYWNNNKLSTEDIAQKFNISRPTVASYLRKGVELNLCDYTPGKSRSYGSLKVDRSNTVHSGIKVRCIELDLCFNSCTECANYLCEKFKTPFNKAHISACCRGERFSHKGFTFEKIN